MSIDTIGHAVIRSAAVAVPAIMAVREFVVGDVGGALGFVLMEVIAISWVGFMVLSERRRRRRRP